MIAHEIAHVTQDHIPRMLAAQSQSYWPTMAALALALLASRSNPNVASAAIATTQAYSRIHHLNCATLRPFAFILSDTATVTSFAHLVVHCLLIETNDGLVLVDSGFGIRDRTRPTPFENAFMTLSRSSRDLAETAAHQVLSLGYAVEDVQHILQTHLHMDHAGGLSDFPQAKIHVHAVEHDAAMHPRTFSELFYLPARWINQAKWVRYTSPTEQWFGFEAIRILEGVSPAIWLIPLPGHTRGHCAVAVQAANLKKSIHNRMVQIGQSVRSFTRLGSAVTR